MPPSVDYVRLARIDATAWEDSRYAYVRHIYYGWRTEPVKELVWRRTFKPIGQGGFGAVYQEECTEGSSKGSARAVKVLVKPTTSGRPSIDYGRELEAIARFSQPQYARFFIHSPGWYETEDAVMVIMELAPHGNLQQHIGLGLPENEVRLILKHVLKGLAYMHSEGYTHRDLKPQNLLVIATGPAWHVKIADFGLSKRIAESLSSMHTNAGTLGFIAPEVLGLCDHDDFTDEGNDSAQQHRQSYTNAVDMWAMGAILHLLVTGVLPFQPQDQAALGKYARGRGIFPKRALEAKRVSADCCAMVKDLMAPNAAERPSAKSGLRHPWLKDNGDSQDRTTLPQAFPVRLSASASSGASGNWTTIDSGYDTQSHGLKLGPRSARSAGAPQASSSRAPAEFEERQSIRVPRESGYDTQRPFPTARGPVTSDQIVEVIATTVQIPCPSLLDVSPDGRFVVAGTENEITLYKVEGTTDAVSVWTHGVQSLIISFSPDGRQLSCLTRDNKIRLLDARTGNLLFEFSNVASQEPAFSHDGSLIAMVVRDRGHQLVDAATGATRHILESDSSLVGEMAFSPDSKIFVSRKEMWIRGEKSGEVIEVWSTETGKRIKTLHDDEFGWQLVFSPNGRYMLSTSTINSNSNSASFIEIWDAQTWRKLPIHQEPTCRIDSAAFSADGASLACGFADGTVKIWDLVEGKQVLSLKASTRGIMDTAFWPNDSTIASGCYNGTVILWNRVTGQKVWELTEISRQIHLPRNGEQVGWTLAHSDGATIQILAKKQP